MPDVPDAPPPEPVPKWPNPATAAAVVTATHVLLGAAAAWFLLTQLAPILQPFLVAVILAYVLMPYHSRLRRHVGGVASLVILAGATAALLVGLGVVVYASVLALSDDLPHLQRRALQLTEEAEQEVRNYAPWVIGPADGQSAQVKLGDRLTRLAGPLLNLAADVLVEACVVALYLLFLLAEGSRFPDRVRRAYSPERAAEILQIAGQVNAAVVSYLKAKVKSSLILAVPVGVVLWAVGVRFALLWAVLTFLCNFIPYIGSVVAFTLPIGFAFLWFGVRWEPVAAAVLVLGCHLASAGLVEPLILGNAVGLSPLVVLGSLAFWGLLWGFAGMVLAVPLTVVAVIVMDHFADTRAVARLLRGG